MSENTEIHQLLGRLVADSEAHKEARREILQAIATLSGKLEPLTGLPNKVDVLENHVTHLQAFKNRAIGRASVIASIAAASGGAVSALIGYLKH